MKVYIAVGSWDYEGHDKPIGVYSTRELAQKALDCGYDHYNETDIFKYKIDDPKTLTPKATSS